MKLATYVHGGRQSYGVVTDRGVADVPAAWPDGPASLLDAIQAGPPATARIRDIAAAQAATAIPLADVKLLAPIPAPPKLLGLAVNYAEHHREIERGADLPAEPRRDTTPRPFLMPATAVAHPGDEIPWCDYSRDIDHEVELAVVIGKGGKRIPRHQAMEHVAGYTILNDVTARDMQTRDMAASHPWFLSKSFDTFGPLGPCLTLPDEIPDPHTLELRLTVNGEVRQESNTRNLIFKIPELIASLSRYITLEPGDLISTGTPEGISPLQPGDVMEAYVEGIGTLRNPVEEEK